MKSSEFSTFYHISQYGDEGYVALPRIVAMSQPCLWAPSSVMLKSRSSQLSTAAFLRYVEEGEIRIFGRSEWLYDSHWRNSRPWQNAAWDTTIDGTIRRICEEDTGKPEEERRVVVAPPEKGDGFAEEYLDANPQEISRWTGVLQRQRGIIPSGTREAALREIDKPILAVRRILRDAYNHGQAILYSGADAPVFVEDVHKDFLRILADAPPLHDNSSREGKGRRDAPRPPTGRIDLQQGTLADELIRLLEQLDVHARNRGELDSLDDFIRSQGRQDLMKWMRELCEVLKYSEPKEIDGLLLVKLRSDFRPGSFPSRVESLLQGKDQDIVTALAIASAAFSIPANPTGAAPMIGVGAGMYSLGKGLLRQIGGAPDTFTGPQWPFLYAYGTKSKRKLLK